MRIAASLSFCIILLSACRDTGVDIPDGLRVIAGSNPQVGDMATPKPPSCIVPAAAGIAGDNLGICVDFAKIGPGPLSSGQLPAELTGWNFGQCSHSWEIANGHLQLQNFGTFAGVCNFMLPSINLNDQDKQKYQSITLSLAQRIDLELGLDSNQLTQIYFKNPIPSLLLTQTSGTQPEQRISITIDRAKLPMALSLAVSYLLQVQATTSVSNKQGWQIGSIAVTGTP